MPFLLKIRRELYPFLAVLSLILVTQIDWLHKHNFHDTHLWSRVLVFCTVAPLIAGLYALNYRRLWDFCLAAKIPASSLSNLHIILMLPLLWRSLLVFDRHGLVTMLSALTFVFFGFVTLVEAGLWERLSLRQRSAVGSIVTLASILSISFYAFGEQTRYFLFLKLWSVQVFFLIWVIVPGYLVTACFCNKYLSESSQYALAIPASIFIFSSLFVLLYTSSIPPKFYGGICWAVIASLVFIAWRQNKLGNLRRLVKNRVFCFAALGAHVVTLAALIFVTAGQSDFSKMNATTFPAERLQHHLPVDNALPYFTTNIFLQHAEPWRWEFWTMGDRPPLMAIIVSIFHWMFPGTEPFTFFEFLQIGTALNCFFFVPFVLLIHHFFKGKPYAFALAVCLALNGFIFFFNTYYTWPKLFGTLFVLSGFYYCWIERKHISIRHGLIAGAVLSLGALCHGGAALSLVVPFIAFFIYNIRFHSWAVASKFAAAVLVAFTLVQQPWSIYKKLHPSINTFHLLAHYYDGYIEERAVVPTPVKQEIERFLRFHKNSTLTQQVGRRWENLEYFLTGADFPAVFQAVLSGDWVEFHRARHRTQFSFFFSNLDEVSMVLAFIALALQGWQRIFPAKYRFLPPLSSGEKQAIWFALIFLLSVLFNVMIRWSPYLNHEGLYPEFVCVAAIVTGIALRINLLLFGFIFIYQLGRWLTYFTWSDIPLLDFNHIVVLTLMLGLLAISFKVQDQTRSD